jgi:hypothetical protein
MQRRRLEKKFSALARPVLGEAGAVRLLDSQARLDTRACVRG